MSMIDRINEVYREMGEALVESGLDFDHKTHAKRFFKENHAIMKLLLDDELIDMTEEELKELKTVLEKWLRFVNKDLELAIKKAEKKKQNNGESVTDNKQQQQQNQYQNNGA